jgi:hypothetical protein
MNLRGAQSSNAVLGGALARRLIFWRPGLLSLPRFEEIFLARPFSSRPFRAGLFEQALLEQALFEEALFEKALVGEPLDYASQRDSKSAA